MKEYIDNFWHYRYLLKELVTKGIKLKYRRSYLGLVWTLLEPLLTTMVLTVVFGKILGKGDATYPVYILCGRLVFSCFSSTSKIAMRSIRANQAMIKKIYVPKYLYPLSAIIYNYILFLLSLIVLAALLYSIKSKNDMAHNRDIYTANHITYFMRCGGTDIVYSVCIL